MHIGVLLLSCEDADRQTTFTADWAEKAVAEVLVFVPGVGFKPIPPRSPLVGVVERVAAVRTLHEAQLVADDGELPALTAHARDLVAELADSLGRVPAEPVLSSLEAAWQRVADVRRTGTAPDADGLAAVEAALAEARATAARR
ncbi:hypothetical protein [Streptomyces sp. NPDC058664]|uniref:hypothetical protein n=1 Tax=unclassified Streptomyces TaxID=2593676 RepID=UPI003666E154